MNPFNREKFLLYLLAGLLAWQATIFTFGVVLCSRVTPTTDISTVCPQLGNRFDKFVQTTLGAVLGLLAGAAVAGVSQKKASTSDRALPSDEQPRQLPRRRSPEKTSAVQAQDQASEEQVEPQEQASSQASETKKKQPPGKR